MSANFLKTALLPRAWSAVDMLPPGLAWKEMRQLRQAFWCVVILDVSFYLFYILFNTFSNQSFSWTWPVEPLAVLLAGILGSMFFGLEMEEKTAPFLFRQPISHKHILITKITAAMAVFLSFIVFALTLHLILAGAWDTICQLVNKDFPAPHLPDYLQTGHPEKNYYLAFLIGGSLSLYWVCAYCSLRFTTVLSSFVIGCGITAIPHVAVMAGITYSHQELGKFSDSYSLITVSLLVLYTIAIAVLIDLLWYRFKTMEEPRGATLTAQAVLPDKVGWIPMKGSSLLSIQLRQNGVLWIATFCVPILLQALIAPMLLKACTTAAPNTSNFDPQYHSLLREFAAITLVAAGAISGLLFWSRAELNGCGFFLHHHPISRVRLFCTKFFPVLLINIFLFLGCLLTLIYSGALNEINGKWYPSTSAATLRQWFCIALFCAQMTALLCGILYSPLRASNLVGFIVAIITTALIYAPAAVFFRRGLGHDLFLHLYDRGGIAFTRLVEQRKMRRAETGHSPGLAAVRICRIPGRMERGCRIHQPD